MSGNLSRNPGRRASKVTRKNTKLSRLLVLALFVVTFLYVGGVAAHIAPPTETRTSDPTFSPSTSAAEFPLGSWQTATPQEVGMDPALFAAAMDRMPSPSVVIRNGRIIGQKGDIARTGYTWSASKSLTALIFARLLQQGRVANYDVAVPNSSVPANPTATFRQFMSMTSDYHLSPHSPGNHYAYNNGGVHFYGTYIKNTFYPGKTEVQMLQDAYVSSLGFQDGLSYNTAGYLSGWDGGWSMSTRDLARVGYLILQNGNWNGQQMLPASFINDLYNNQIPAGATEATGTDPFYNEYPATSRLPGAYSFGFWLPHRGAQFGGQQSQTEATSMSGAFGTSMHISRSKDLIIVGVNTSPDSHTGGKISAATLDMFAAAITGPTPTPTPTPAPDFASGRIAISSDGNDHDCDDITATAMSLALLAKTGNASRLVYYGHSDHIWSTGLDGACNGGNREEEMRISSEETAKLWGGFNLGVFINARSQTASAVSALASQINASSVSNPLWIVGAGPMEVIGRALAASDPSKRQYVIVVSHSEWNNYHAEEPGHGSWNFFELGSVLGTNLKSIIDQNAGLEVDESNYSWLQQSSDPRLNWIWQRHLKSGLSPEFDPSDAGMIYWLITGANNGGDENATPAKLRAILETVSTTPTPTPTPTPNPIPTPTPTPTPTSTPGTLASVLVTAPEGTPLHIVDNGTTINLATLPTRSLSIEVVPSTPVGSIRLQFNGQDRTENVAPYALAGDTDGAFHPADLPPGTHTLTVTPYPQPNLGGTPGASTTISFVVVDEANTTPPTLLTEEFSDRAIAFNATTFVQGPFALFTEQNFSQDKRTRVILFVANLESSTGSNTLVQAENAVLGTVSLPIEHVGRVPNFEWITQIKIVLPDGLANAGDVWVRVVSGGVSSNQARIAIKQGGVAANTAPSMLRFLEDVWIRPDRRLQLLNAPSWPRAS